MKRLIESYLLWKLTKLSRFIIKIVRKTHNKAFRFAKSTKPGSLLFTKLLLIISGTFIRINTLILKKMAKMDNDLRESRKYV